MSKKLISWDDVALELPAAVKASLDADYDPAGAATATLVDAAVMITEQSDADKAAAISTYALADPVTAITYNGDGTVSSVTENGTATTYTYNGDGTVATQTRLGTTRTFTYTGANLTAVA